ncbi:MAG: M48 family metallopeptidase [Bacteroidota bacterium]|nr:M48 family metallopeptidase [Bacteroidota bacterium]
MKKLSLNAGLIALLLVLFTGCSTVMLTGRKQFNVVTDAEMLTIADSSYKAYMATATVSKKTTQSALVSRVGSKITTAVQNYLSAKGQSSLIEGYNWDFKLVVDTAVNAFCMPGGKIVVYEGLLPVTLSEAGLAVVLGHEIAHAVAKHSNERLSQQMAVNGLLSAAGSLVQNQSTFLKTALPTVLGLGAEYGVMLPYSRKQEYEADHLGLIFMAMAGYDPAEALTFWSRMAAKSSVSVPEILSTHPTDAKRIANLQALLPEAQKYYNK